LPGRGLPPIFPLEAMPYLLAFVAVFVLGLLVSCAIS
jgi:hypothetical protein